MTLFFSSDCEACKTCAVPLECFVLVLLSFSSLEPGWEGDNRGSPRDGMVPVVHCAICLPKKIFATGASRSTKIRIACCVSIFSAAHAPLPHARPCPLPASKCSRQVACTDAITRPLFGAPSPPPFRARGPCATDLAWHTVWHIICLPQADANFRSRHDMCLTGADFGQLFDRLWPNVGLTDFGQTDFGQYECFNVTDFGKPTLTNFSVLVFWPNFRNPKSPNPNDPKTYIQT